MTRPASSVAAQRPRQRGLSLLLLAAASTAAGAETPPQWMFGVTGGSIGRDGDDPRAYGTAALTRRVGRGYVRASATRFGSSVRQVDVDLPSTYTLGFLSAGTTFGRWFADVYGAAGNQHYRPIGTDLGRRAIAGPRDSFVVGGGGDGGYVLPLGPSWRLTPSASLQYYRSKALREQVGPMGPSEYETRETGATFGGTLRADRLLGASRTSAIGLHVTRFQTTNASAALTSGTRGALYPGTQSGRGGDGWTEIGGNAVVRLTGSLYLDVGASRTFGATAGDLTTTALGGRFVF